MALTHSPSIVRDGLVLHLDAANVKSYPGSGTAIDSLLPKDEIIPAVPFDNTGVWISTSPGPVVTGARSFTTAAGGQGLYLSAVITVGRRYRIKLALSQCQGTFEIRNSAGAGAGTLLFATTSAGVYQVDFVADNSSVYLRAATSLAVEFAGLSLTEITGTLSGGVGYSSDNGGGFVFDGVGSQKITTSHSAQLNLATEVTLSAVFNQVGAATSNFQRIIDKGGRLTFWLDDLDRKIYVRWGTTPNNFPMNYVFNQNQIYHVMLTYKIDASDGRTKLFVNGVLVATADDYSGNLLTNASDVVIGNWEANTRSWNGSINSVMIYDRALAAAEIAQNFEALRGRYGV